MAKKTLVFSPFAHDFDFPGFSLLPVKRVGSGEESQKEEEASTEFFPLRPQFCQKKRERKYAALCSLPVSHTHFRKRGLHSFKRFFFPVQRHLCNAKDFFSQCVLRLRPRRREQKAKLNSPPDTMYCIRHQNRISRCLFFPSFFSGVCAEGEETGFCLSLARSLDRSLQLRTERKRMRREFGRNTMCFFHRHLHPNIHFPNNDKAISHFCF